MAWYGQRVEVGQYRRNTRLGVVGAIHIRSALAGDRAAVAVLGVPVVGAGLRIGIFDLTAGGVAGLPLTIGVVNQAAESEHDMVRAGSTHHRLMEVVAQRVLLRQLSEVRHVALGDVEKLHRRRAFTGGLIGERAGLRSTITAGADRSLDPREQIVLTSAVIAAVALVASQSSCCHIWKEAMDRAAGVVVVGERRIHRSGPLKFGSERIDIGPLDGERKPRYRSRGLRVRYRH